MHEIRKALRGRAVVLMGKNTMVRRALRILMADFPEYERLLPHIRGTLHPPPPSATTASSTTTATASPRRRGTKKKKKKGLIA